MANVPPRHMTTDAQSLPDHIRTQAAASLARPSSGARKLPRPREGLANMLTGAGIIRNRIAHILDGPIWARVLPSRSTCVAWHIGRFVGRIEGALKLALFGVRLWWRRRNTRHDHTPSA